MNGEVNKTYFVQESSQPFSHLNLIALTWGRCEPAPHLHGHVDAGASGFDISKDGKAWGQVPGLCGRTNRKWVSS